MLLDRRLYIGTVMIVLTVAASYVSPVLAQTTISIPLAREQITVTSLGAIQVTQTISAVNTGSSTLSSISVTIPESAYSITASDDMGPLTLTSAEGDVGKSVTVSLRYNLRAAYNDSYTFSLHYSLASDIYIAQRGLGIFSLELNASTGFELSVSEFTVTVILPEGSTFSSSEPEAQIGATGLGPVVSFTFRNVQPNDSPHVLVNYGFSPIWSGFRPTIWVATIVAIAGFALLLRRDEKPKVTEGDANVDLVRSFVNSLDEELALRDDQDQLDEALDDGSIGRKDYNRRRRMLDDRSRSLSESMVRLRQNLRQISPRYARLVDRVEDAENEMITLRSSFSRTLAQFRSGKVSRSSFENLKENYDKRLSRVKASVETVIIELRGEV